MRFCPCSFCIERLFELRKPADAGAPAEGRQRDCPLCRQGHEEAVQSFKGCAAAGMPQGEPGGWLHLHATAEAVGASWRTAYMAAWCLMKAATPGLPIITAVTQPHPEHLFWSAGKRCGSQSCGPTLLWTSRRGRPFPTCMLGGSETCSRLARWAPGIAALGQQKQLHGSCKAAWVPRDPQVHTRLLPPWLVRWQPSGVPPPAQTLRSPGSLLAATAGACTPGGPPAGAPSPLRGQPACAAGPAGKQHMHASACSRIAR